MNVFGLNRIFSKKRYCIAAFPAALLILLTALLVGGCGQKTGAETGTGAENSVETGEMVTEAAISVEEQLKLAWNFLTEGDYKEAVLAFTAVIEIDPRNGEAYRGRAESYMGRASEADSAEDYASYLAMAAGDYEQAAMYLEDEESLEAARRAQNENLYAGCMERAQAAMESDNTEEMFEQLRRASLIEGAAYLAFEYMDDYYNGFLNYIRDGRDTDTALAYCRLMMEITENSGLREDDSLSLMQLAAMIVGYTEQVFVTTEYIEAINRPILDFVRAHEEYNVNSAAIEILYRGSIALGDMETAAQAYALMLDKIRDGTWAYSNSSRSYDYREDGYSWTGTNNAGYRHSTSEFDIYGHCLATTAHLDKYDGPNGHVPSDTDEVWSYQYESGGPRLMEAKVTSTNARGTHTIVRTYTYEDGRLVRLDEFYVEQGEHGITDYSYSGMDVTVTYTGTDGRVRTEERVVNFNGSAALLK